MRIRELWSERDAQHHDALLSAVEARDLQRALLAIGRTHDDDALWCAARLAQWGERLAERTHRIDPPRAQIEALQELLTEDLAFKGDKRDYNNPRNSSLYDVLRRRRGMPILLSAVWILVGREAGLTVDGVGMPCHFIARVGGPQGLLIDPFAGGDILTRDACIELVNKLSRNTLRWKDAWLDPTPVRGIAERVLRNMVNSYNTRGEAEPLYRTCRMLAALRPDDISVLYMHARTSEEVGALDEAGALYTTILTRAPESNEGERAGIRLSRLGAKARLVH